MAGNVELGQGGITQFTKIAASGDEGHAASFLRVYCKESRWYEKKDQPGFVNEGPTVPKLDKIWVDDENNLFSRGLGSHRGYGMYVTESMFGHPKEGHPDDRCALDVSLNRYRLPSSL